MKSYIPWIDSHCHWDFAELQQDRSHLISSMAQHNVRMCIVPGVRAETLPALVDIATRDQFAFALGLHPYFVSEHDQQAVEHVQSLIKALAGHNDFVAIGECGLDRPQAEISLKDNEDCPFDRSEHWHHQVTLFKQHIEWATHYKLPLIIHARGTNDQCCSLLRRQSFQNGGVVHAFSGSQQQAQKWLDLGFKVGLGGACTHQRAKKLQRVIQYLPMDGWVLETDAPDMRPAFCQPKKNSPLMIPLTAAIIAHLKGVELADIQYHAYHNTLTAFPRLTLKN